MTDLRALLGDKYDEMIERAVDVTSDSVDYFGCGCCSCYDYDAARERTGHDDRVHFAIHDALAAVLPGLLENPRDEYHTMEELYDYRMLYNALAANALADISCKSWRHSDGEECFGGGWFVVYMTLPGIGQVSNHYRAEHWDLFHVPEVERAPEYDGHTPQDAAERLRQAARDGLPAVLPDLLARALDEDF